MSFCRHWKLTVFWYSCGRFARVFIFYIGCEAGLTEEPKSNKRSGTVPERLLGYFFLGEHHEQCTNKPGGV